MLRLRFPGEDDTLVAQEDKNSGLLLLLGDVAEDWNQTVASIVKNRVAAVARMARIEIFCSSESRKKTNEYLTSIIMTEAAIALDELVLDPVRYANCSITFVSNVTTLYCSVCRKHIITQEVLNNFSYLDHGKWWGSLEIFLERSILTLRERFLSMSYLIGICGRDF